MPAQERFKTKYAGVFYIEGRAVGSHKNEKIYYILYRKNGKQIFEKAGRQYQDDMTPARAAGMRSRRIEGKEPTNAERREAEESAKKAKQGKWIIDKLAKEYFKNRRPGKSVGTDQGRYDKYLKKAFGKKEPNEIAPLDCDRLRIQLLKRLSPQTVKHVLNLLTWIINYGLKKNLITSGLSFKIQKPTVQNERTEYLNQAQIKNLLEAIDKDSNTQIGNLMKLALFTGMRRGELLNLKWVDLNFDFNYILIRDPKGGQDQKIPMNDETKKILLNHPRVKKSEYVFPNPDGKKRVSVQAQVNKIKKAAGLPDEFRPLHGLRHAYASMLASSGRVDLYVLQRLMTHKDFRMTARYAHLRDETLRRGSNVAGSIVNQALNHDDENKKIIDLKKRK